MRYRLRTLLTFSVRDLLLLTTIVALVIMWTKDRAKWSTERNELIQQRDEGIANEKRLAVLRSREMAGQLISVPRWVEPKAKTTAPPLPDASRMPVSP